MPTLQQINREGAYFFVVLRGTGRTKTNRQDRNEKNTPPAPADRLLLARRSTRRSPLRHTEVITADSLDNDAELLERLRNMPNLEVGKGITFRPKSNWFSLTMRFRMQNMVGLSFDKDFTLTKTDAQVKRLRLRFDGHIYSPKLVYSIQLGFTSYDTEPLPNGNMNIVRDAIVYYVPQSQMEHRVRPDQDQGQPGAHQLVERPCSSSTGASSIANSTSTATSDSSANTTCVRATDSTSRPKAP